MRIKINEGEEIRIQCYSPRDGKIYEAIVISDDYGRLSFQNLN